MATGFADSGSWHYSETEKTKRTWMRDDSCSVILKNYLTCHQELPSSRAALAHMGDRAGRARSKWSDPRHSSAARPGKKYSAWTRPGSLLVLLSTAFRPATYEFVRHFWAKVAAFNLCVDRRHCGCQGPIP